MQSLGTYFNFYLPLTLPEVWLLDDGPQYPWVADDHDDEGDEVNGDEEEQGEGGDGSGVRAEGHALLGSGIVRRRLGVPHEDLYRIWLKWICSNAYTVRTFTYSKPGIPKGPWVYLCRFLLKTAFFKDTMRKRYFLSKREKSWRDRKHQALHECKYVKLEFDILIHRIFYI